VCTKPEIHSLLIDDIRNLPGSTLIARTYSAGLECLRKFKVYSLYLDHDLGEVDERHTGYGIMCFLEEHPEFLPDKIILVTSNPVGRQRMQQIIDKLYPPD
jgi:hypothetical protein